MEIKWIKEQREIPAVGIINPGQIINVEQEMADNLVRGRFAIYYNIKEIEESSNKKSKKGRK